MINLNPLISFAFKFLIWFVSPILFGCAAIDHFNGGIGLIDAQVYSVSFAVLSAYLIAFSFLYHISVKKNKSITIRITR